MAETKQKKDIVDRAWEVQHRIEERANRVGKGKYGRVLKMARKPDQEEYMRTSKITLAGLVILGGLGFAIFWLMTQLPRLLGI